MSRPKNRGLGAMTLLVWVANSSGRITDGHNRVLQEFAHSQQDTQIYDLALSVAPTMNRSDLRAACDAVRMLPEQGKASFLKWAVDVALSSTQIPNSTNYVLRFLADVAEIDIDEFLPKIRKGAPAAR